MTKPTSSQEAARAKEALKKRIVDLLVGEKTNTEKIKKLLAKSSQYEAFLVHQATDNLEFFKSHGASDNSETRGVAHKSATAEVDQLLKDTIAGLKGEFQQRVTDAMTTIDHMEEGAREKIERSRRVIAAIEEITEYEFIKDITSKNILTITFDKGSVTRARSDLKGRLESLASLRKELTKAATSDEERKLREALRTFNEKLEKARTSIGRSSGALTEALNTTSVAIDEKALEALISQKVAKEDLETLAAARGWLDRFISVASAVMEKNTVTGTISKALKLFNASAHAVARNEMIDDEAGEYRKGHTRGEVVAEHEANPLMLAQNLVERQKIALDILMKSLDTTLSGAMIATLGPGEIVMQAWAPISVAITKIVTSRLDARLKLAKDAVAARNAALALQYESDKEKELEEQIKDGVLEVLTSGAEKFVEKAREQFLPSENAEGGAGEAAKHGLGILDSIKENPGDFTATVLGWIMPPLMAQIWKIFPPKPAEEVSGSDLDAMQNTLFQASVPLSMQGTPYVAPPKQPVTAITDRPDDVAAGIWAKFVKTNAGRTQSGDDPAQRVYNVAVRVATFGNATVWGWFDPRTNEFTPDRLDDSSIDDWSDRTIAGRGYSDGAIAVGGPTVTGSWLVLTVGTWRYVALVSGSTMRFGGWAANTRGPRGVASTLGAIVSPLSPEERTMEAFTLTG